MSRPGPLHHHHLIVNPDTANIFSSGRIPQQSLCSIHFSVWYLQLLSKTLALYNRIIQLSLYMHCIPKRRRQIINQFGNLRTIVDTTTYLMLVNESFETFNQARPRQWAHYVWMINHKSRVTRVESTLEGTKVKFMELDIDSFNMFSFFLFRNIIQSIRFKRP